MEIIGPLMFAFLAWVLHSPEEKKEMTTREKINRQC